MSDDHDPVGDVKPQARAPAGLLGREEGVEDPVHDPVGYSGSVVGHLHCHTVAVAGGGDPDATDGRVFLGCTPLRDRVGGVVDEVRPDLVQLAAARLDAVQVSFVVALHDDSAELVAEIQEQIDDINRGG